MFQMIRLLILSNRFQRCFNLLPADNIENCKRDILFITLAGIDRCHGFYDYIMMKLNIIGTAEKILLLFIFIIVNSLFASCTASAPALHTKYFWEKTYGSSNNETFGDIERVFDGYIIAGSTYSENNKDDVLIIKIDKSGSIVWYKKYGNRDYDRALAVKKIYKGFIAAGMTGVSGKATRDAWLLKIDSDGDIIWNKMLGGSGNEVLRSMDVEPDGYIFVGETSSFGRGKQSIWAVKTDKHGVIRWHNALGKGPLNKGVDIKKTGDGYILIGDILRDGASDVIVVKLDKKGRKVWERIYGGNMDDYAASIKVLPDGYVIAATTESKGAGGKDAWLLKLDANGRLEWDNTLGGSEDDSARYIEDIGNGFVISGSSASASFKFNEMAWIVKTDFYGNKIWERFYKKAFVAEKVIRTPRGYIIAGVTSKFGAGKGDIWVVKVDEDGKLNERSEPAGKKK